MVCNITVHNPVMVQSLHNTMFGAHMSIDHVISELFYKGTIL